MTSAHPESSAQSVRRRTRTVSNRVLAGLLVALLMTIVTPGLLGCGSKSGSSVNIHDLQFDPQVLTVTKGTTVTWTNNDQTAHTVTSDSADSTTAPAAQKFTSNPLNPGESYTHTFDQPGRYPYHCNIHPYLKGEVIVK